MSYYAYVDESGTLAEHRVMTVSLVLLYGRRAADRISERILKEVHPHLADDLKVLLKKQLHFTDTSARAQNLTAGILAKEKITVVIALHWHSGEDEPHEVVFARYTKLVELLLYTALDLTSGKMTLVIAKQGGWETYAETFLAELRNCAELFCRRKKLYRSIDYELRSAQQVRGLQLADFYAGAGRKFLLDSLSDSGFRSRNPFDRIEHQILWADYVDH